MGRRRSGRRPPAYSVTEPRSFFILSRGDFAAARDQRDYIGGKRGDEFLLSPPSCDELALPLAPAKPARTRGSWRHRPVSPISLPVPPPTVPGPRAPSPARDLLCRYVPVHPLVPLRRFVLLVPGRACALLLARQEGGATVRRERRVSWSFGLRFCWVALGGLGGEGNLLPHLVRRSRVPSRGGPRVSSGASAYY